MIHLEHSFLILTGAVWLASLVASFALGGLVTKRTMLAHPVVALAYQAAPIVTQIGAYAHAFAPQLRSLRSRGGPRLVGGGHHTEAEENGVRTEPGSRIKAAGNQTGGSRSGEAPASLRSPERERAQGRQGVGSGAPREEGR